MCVPICNRFHTRKTNRVKMAFLEGVSFFDTLVRGEPPNTEARNFVMKNTLRQPTVKILWL